MAATVRHGFSIRGRSLKVAIFGLLFILAATMAMTIGLPWWKSRDTEAAVSTPQNFRLTVVITDDHGTNTVLMSPGELWHITVPKKMAPLGVNILGDDVRVKAIQDGLPARPFASFAAGTQLLLDQPGRGTTYQFWPVGQKNVPPIFVRAIYEEQDGWIANWWCEPLTSAMTGIKPTPAPTTEIES